MRELSTIEMSKVSGADAGENAAAGAASAVGGVLGSAAGSRVGLPTVGLAVGSAVGSAVGGPMYESARDEAMEWIKYWRSGSNGFQGSAFAPQTPTKK